LFKKGLLSLARGAGVVADLFRERLPRLAFQIGITMGIPLITITVKPGASTCPATPGASTCPSANTNGSGKQDAGENQSKKLLHSGFLFWEGSVERRQFSKFNCQMTVRNQTDLKILTDHLNVGIVLRAEGKYRDALEHHLSMQERIEEAGDLIRVNFTSGLEIHTRR
jgi:hypothetical protein